MSVKGGRGFVMEGSILQCGDIVCDWIDVDQ